MAFVRKDGKTIKVPKCCVPAYVEQGYVALKDANTAAAEASPFPLKRQEVRGSAKFVPKAKEKEASQEKGAVNKQSVGGAAVLGGVTFDTTETTGNAGNAPSQAEKPKRRGRPKKAE
jgi:hypothetical protein